MCNNHLQPVVPSMVNAIKDPEKCADALEDLMHTTFVHMMRLPEILGGRLRRRERA